LEPNARGCASGKWIWRRGRSLAMSGCGSDHPMTSKISRRPLQPPAKPVGQRASKTAKVDQVPAVARRGRLTLRQIKHAVDTALRGQTFEADAQG
jgi:hypothetical protein